MGACWVLARGILGGVVLGFAFAERLGCARISNRRSITLSKGRVLCYAALLSEPTPKAFGLWTADRSPDSRDDGHETETLNDKAVS
jgi:hypothetical protein